MPPDLLIWFTKTWMAFFCWPYSAAVARSNRPATLLSEITGNTTLMAWADTPRALVLAWLTGVGLNAATSDAPAMPEDPGVPAGARTNQPRRPIRTTAMMRTV